MCVLSFGRAPTDIGIRVSQSSQIHLRATEKYTIDIFGSATSTGACQHAPQPVHKHNNSHDLVGHQHHVERHSDYHRQPLLLRDQLIRPVFVEPIPLRRHRLVHLFAHHLMTGANFKFHHVHRRFLHIPPHILVIGVQNVFVHVLRFWRHHIHLLPHHHRHRLAV